MPLTRLFLLSLVLALPLYVTLNAATLVLPAYSICLVLAGLLLWFSLRSHKQNWSDEAVLLVMLLGGVALAVVGFAMAPLIIKILMVCLIVLQYRQVGLALN